MTTRSKKKEKKLPTLDVLDETRIHPDDYKLARIMAGACLEKDMEQVEDNSSAVVELLSKGKDQVKKL